MAHLRKALHILFITSAECRRFIFVDRQQITAFEAAGARKFIKFIHQARCRAERARRVRALHQADSGAHGHLRRRHDERLRIQRKLIQRIIHIRRVHQIAGALRGGNVANRLIRILHAYAVHRGSLLRLRNESRIHARIAHHFKQRAARVIHAHHADGHDGGFGRKHARDVMQYDVLLTIIAGRRERGKPRFVARKRAVSIQFKQNARTDAARADELIKSKLHHRSPH